MMTNEELIRQLWGLKKHVPWVNYQQGQLVASAANRIEELARKLAIQDKAILEKDAAIKELKYRLAEREGIQAENVLPAVSKGKPDEDFWDDFWPVEGDGECEVNGNA